MLLSDLWHMIIMAWFMVYTPGAQLWWLVSSCCPTMPLLTAAQHCFCHCCLHCATGGWSADEHALFVRLRALAFKSGAGGCKAGKGCSRSAVIERLQLMMPGKSKQQLEEHEKWWGAHAVPGPALSAAFPQQL